MEFKLIALYSGIVLLGLLAINGTGIFDAIKIMRPELRRKIMLILSIIAFALISYSYYILRVVK